MTAPLATAIRAGKINLARDRFPDLGPRAYGLVVEGDCMRPRFASGDALVIDPDRIPKQGDFVVVFGASDPGLCHVVVGAEPVRARQ